MTLVTIRNLSIRFRGPPLLDHVSCRIERGERVGLLGRNGAGKTTLLRILRGEVEPDSGEVELATGAVVSLAPQSAPRGLGGRIADIVSAGRSRGAAERSEPLWRAEQRVERVLSRMNLDGDTLYDTLSSGMKRRVLIARALAADPDLLLLDEPTNHLDTAAIEWLEQFLSRWAGALLFVTHDRMFLRKLAGRILELDRGGLFDWCCDYDTFLRRKEAWLAAEQKQNAMFDKKLAQEEAWIRRGIKARRTRNEGRVRALRRMRRERRERRDAPGQVRMRLEQEARSGDLVAQLRHVSFAYGDQPILHDFSTTILRGDKIGIIGSNGAGKTTLLRLLLGELTPTQGQVRLGANLQIAYFDQQREQLAPDRSAMENVGEGADSVRIGGKTKHIIGYLQDFLFTPERARTPVRFLSGGECNRVLLARLFARPANVVVLDEPTNDLDIETLDLLEDLLVAYEGTVFLVSHDRCFLNNVVAGLIALEDGRAKEYVGGYDDWLRRRSADDEGGGVQADKKPAAGRRETAPPRKAKRSTTPPERAARAARLTYKEKQELAALPGTIEQVEAEIAGLHDAMSRPEFYKRPGEQISRDADSLRRLEDQLAEAYRRWEELEERTDSRPR